MGDLLSVVVVHYNIPREFPRTLYSLSPAFQQGISADEYEVIVVDNGSERGPRISEARELGLDVRVIKVPEPTVSPARAANLGLNASIGRYVGVMIDGARLVSPGLLATARDALSIDGRAVVGSRGRYLGPDTQRKSVKMGYSKKVEDESLESIDWRHNGYGLFGISVFDESSGPDWFAPVSESNSLFMSRALWAESGGYDEVFDEPGGGYVNLDMWRRACELPGVRPTLLLGEATFHQLHGGVATNSTEEATAQMRQRYEEIRQQPWARPSARLYFYGSLDKRPPLKELGLTARERRDIAQSERRRVARAEANKRRRGKAARRARIKAFIPSAVRRRLRPVKRRLGALRRRLRV